jgi:adenylate kinase
MRRLGFDLILLGDPTAGKDTQAGILMKKYSLKPVESGKYWRAMAKKNNAEGRWLRQTMSLGGPTPVPLMKKFLIDQIAKAPKDKDLIFVGNPRLAPEAKLLKKLLDKKHRDFFVLFLKLPVREILRRSKERISAQDRKDDSKIAYVKKRMSWQDPKNSKAVKYFQGLHKLKFIDSVPPIPTVAANIQKAINDYQRS